MNIHKRRAALQIEVCASGWPALIETERQLTCTHDAAHLKRRCVVERQEGAAVAVSVELDKHILQELS